MHTLPSPSTPVQTEVRTFLSAFRGCRIFHPPLVDHEGRLVGNNGDRLMVLGTDIVYRDLNIEVVDSGEKADLIAIGGNGGMLERAYHIPRIFRECSQGFPRTPMCVLPSTYYYPKRPFASEIGARTAPLTLFCREAYSYKHLTEDHTLPEHCRVVLDRDMAFELEGGALVNRLKAMQTKHVLFVERTDVEKDSASFGSTSTGALSKARKRMPGPLKKLLYPMVKAVRSRRATPFRDECERLIAERCPDVGKLPRRAGDMSNVNVCDFEEFCSTIGEAAAVFTTRLHVGILSAMIGRRTFVFGGPYHKIRGIFEHSLAGRDGVEFVSSS
jgi:exopolysaccharide biosynthesis predicted pyruvyltransferase EpsI